jgi:hypothetical protein
VILAAILLMLMMCRVINKLAFTEVPQDHNALSLGLSYPLGLINRKSERNTIPQNVGKILKIERKQHFTKVKLKTANSLDAFHT